MDHREREYWEKAAGFHGHVCGGLAIGFQAARYAIKLLELTFSEDEQVVCISENDACGVDAIQAVLGGSRRSPFITGRPERGSACILRPGRPRALQRRRRAGFIWSVLLRSCLRFRSRD